MQIYDDHILFDARLSAEGRKRLIADFGKVGKTLQGRNSQGEAVEVVVKASSLTITTKRMDGSTYIIHCNRSGYVQNKKFCFNAYWDEVKVEALWKDPSPQIHCHIQYYDEYCPTPRHKVPIKRCVAEDITATLSTATMDQMVHTYDIKEPHVTTPLYSFDSKLWRKCRIRQDIYSGASTDDALYELKKKCFNDNTFCYGEWHDEKKDFAMMKVQQRLSRFLLVDGQLYFRVYNPVYMVTPEGKLCINYNEVTAFSASERDQAMALVNERLNPAWDNVKTANAQTFIQVIQPESPAIPVKEKEEEMPMAADYPGLPNICPLCYGELWYTDSTPDYLYWQCTRCGATGKEGKDWVNSDAIFDGYHYDVTPAPKVNYECSFTVHKDLSTCADSMLFDSGTQIATLIYVQDDQKVVMDLEVRGEVKVDFDGISYRHASGFPPELTLAIEKHPNTWDHALENDGHAICIRDNNWFEFMYEHHTKDGKQCSDGIMCEELLHELSGDALQDVMVGLCKKIVEDEGDGE